MAKKKSTKAADAVETTEEMDMATEHSHEELEAKIEELSARIEALESSTVLEAAEEKAHAIVAAAFDKVGDVVEEKVKKAVSNIKAGKVDLDFEELFQWFALRRKNGRPFRK